MSSVPSASDMPSRNPCAALHEGEIRCPAKGSDIIGAGRCVTTECGMVEAFGQRPAALRVVEFARSKIGVDSAGRSPTRTPMRDCYICPGIAKLGEKTCGPACEEKLRAWLDREAAGGVGAWARKTGVGPSAWMATKKAVRR